MRQTARSAAWVAIATAVATFAGPVTSAHADAGDRLTGGCGFVTHQNSVATNGQNQGVIYDLSLSQEQSGTPSDATVSCWIEVNGSEAPGTRITATDDTVQGVEAADAQITFAADAGLAGSDFVFLCQQVTFADGSTWVAPDGSVGTDCRFVSSAQIPPSVVFDLLSTVNDAAVCPALVTLGQITGGGIAGAVLINPDGDLYVAQPLGRGYIWVYDCAPFGDGTGTPLLGPGTIPIGTDQVLFLFPPTLPV